MKSDPNRDATTPQTQSTDNHPRISAEFADALDVIAHPHRREILRRFAALSSNNDEPVALSVDELSTSLAGTFEWSVGNIETSLHHSHIPKMHAHNALHFDPDAQTLYTTRETAAYASLIDAAEAFIAGGDDQ